MSLNILNVDETLKIVGVQVMLEQLTQFFQGIIAKSTPEGRLYYERKPNNFQNLTNSIVPSINVVLSTRKIIHQCIVVIGLFLNYS